MSAAEAHPPTHVLAELAEGVLDDTQAREVRAHVDQCLTCQGTLDELAQVSVSLRALPAELPVPEFVAARISHAIAAERSSGGTGAASGTSGARSGADGGTVAWFRRRLPQGLAAAASVAVVGLAGYVVVSGGTGGGDDTTAADAGAGAAEQAAPDESTTLDSRVQPPPGGDAEDDGSSFSTLTEGGELPTTARLDAAALSAAVESVVQRGLTTVSGCGETLSAELGLPLVGTDTVGAGVLVVLDGGDSYDGWLLSTCNSLSNEELEPHVEVPKAE